MIKAYIIEKEGVVYNTLYLNNHKNNETLYVKTYKRSEKDLKRVEAKNELLEFAKLYKINVHPFN